MQGTLPLKLVMPKKVKMLPTGLQTDAAKSAKGGSQTSQRAEIN